jgi:two-component system OmpR family sensor kinase
MRSLRLRNWSLRWQVVGILSTLLALVLTVVTVTVTLVLSSTLIGEVDAKLESAANRAQNAPSLTEGSATSSSAASASPSASSAPDSSGPPRPSAPDSSAPEPSARGEGTDPRPPGLLRGGQGAGLLNVLREDGTTRSGYFDEHGKFHRLTVAQQRALLAVSPRQGATSVQVPGLGLYRAIASAGEAGERAVIALPLQEIQDTTTRTALVLIVIDIAAFLLALVLGLLMTARALRPLQAVATVATRVTAVPLGQGEVSLTERVPAVYERRQTEVGQVARSVNVMLGHIEEGFEARAGVERKLRRFVADASHELRTPLASVLGYTQLVLQRGEELSPQVREALQRVGSEAQRMSGLVDDLLLLARLDSQPVVRQDPVDVREVLIEAVADAHAAGPDHGWHLDLDGDEDLVVVGDEARLRQVFGNLLTNARVHTPTGTQVRVTVRGEGGWVRVSIVDDGPGIPAEVLPHVFDRFVQASGSRTSRAGSSGLGLSIVQGIVTAHHGTVTVDSHPGRTEFVVRIPLSE